MRVNRNGKPRLLRPPRTADELLRLTLRRINSMKPEEGAQSLVHAGILTKAGRLRKRYGGEAP